MLVAIAFTPSAPVLVPELAGAAAAEVADLRAAVIAAAADLPDRWIAIGVGPADETFDRVGGTFAGYGVDVPAALCPGLAAGKPAALPLCGLIAGWLRGQANPAASATVHSYAAVKDAAAAVTCGRALRAQIDLVAEPTGVLVVADGANTLTPAAPGGFDPAAEPVQAALDDALAAADADELVGLPHGVVGRVAYQVLAGLVGAQDWTGRELYRGAPYGVGYFAGLWTP